MDKFYNIMDKFFIIFCLTSAIYYTLICPCENILSCHKRLFYMLLIFPLLYVFFSNKI